MTNIELSELGQTTHFAKVENLFHIGLQADSRELADIIETIIDHGCFYEVFGKINTIIDEGLDIEELIEILFKNNKLGFIAEVNHPWMSNFKYDEKETITGSSISESTWRTSYVYAETLDDLAKEIEKKSDEIYKYYIEEDKKKANKKV